MSIKMNEVGNDQSRSPEARGNPPPLPKTSWFGVKKPTIITVCISVFLGTLGIVLLLSIREGARRVTCNGRLKMLGTALGMYSDDKGGLPDPTHWCDLLRPYTGNADRIFVCPSDKTPGVRCSYVFNHNLKSNSWMGDPTMVLLFEVEGAGWNAHGGPEMLEKKSPHKDGGNVLWTDGHVDWIRWPELKECLQASTTKQ
jgi:prepilin-type processing-associated H-X9-DG protein